MSSDGISSLIREFKGKVGNGKDWKLAIYEEGNWEGKFK